MYWGHEREERMCVATILHVEHLAVVGGLIFFDPDGAPRVAHRVGVALARRHLDEVAGGALAACSAKWRH